MKVLETEDVVPCGFSVTRQVAYFCPNNFKTVEGLTIYRYHVSGDRKSLFLYKCHKNKREGRLVFKKVAVVDFISYHLEDLKKHKKKQSNKRKQGIKPWSWQIYYIAGKTIW